MGDATIGNMIDVDDIEVIGLAGSTLVECGTALPIVHRRGDGMFCRLVVGPEPLQWFPGSEFDHLVSTGRISPFEFPVLLPSSALSEQPLVIYVNQVFLEALNTALPADWEGMPCVWTPMPRETVFTSAACLPGEKAKAVLNEMAETILERLDAGIPRNRNRDDNAALLQLTDFGLCAATDKNLRWRLYLRYGAALPADRVSRTFVTFIQREFPDCQWQSYLAEMQSLHAVLLSRNPTPHVLLSPASSETASTQQRESDDEYTRSAEQIRPVTARPAGLNQSAVSVVPITSVPAALSMASESTQSAESPDRRGRIRARPFSPFSKASGSTQSAEEQIVRLTADIQDIKNYLQTHPTDFAKRLGLRSKSSRLRKLLGQLKRESRKRYQLIIAALGIRKLGIRK